MFVLPIFFSLLFSININFFLKHLTYTPIFSFTSIYSLDVLYLVLIVILSLSLTNSNNIHNLFMIMLFLLFTIIFLIVDLGLEPLSYFFLIGELSTLLIIYIISFSKSIKKSNSTGYNLLLLLPWLFVHPTSSENMFQFFSFNTINSSFNDFAIFILSIFITHQNVFILLLLVFLFSLVVVLKYRSKTLLNTIENPNYLSLVTNNLFLFRKNIIKKWF